MWKNNKNNTEINQSKPQEETSEEFNKEIENETDNEQDNQNNSSEQYHSEFTKQEHTDINQNNINYENHNNYNKKNKSTCTKCDFYKKIFSNIAFSQNLATRIISSIIILPIILYFLIKKGFFFSLLSVLTYDQAIWEVHKTITQNQIDNSKPHILTSYLAWRLIILLFITSMLTIRYSSNGLINSFWLISSVIAVDTGAYFIGREFGKKKLAPTISPNKTYIGFFGGLICSIMIGLFFYKIINNIGIFKIIIIQSIITILAQFGDLYESAFKRVYGIKDTGNIIPGHGGLLDRIDGFLFTSMFMAILTLLKII